MCGVIVSSATVLIIRCSRSGGGGTEQGRGAAFAAVDIEEVAGKLAAGGGGTAANPAGVAVDDGALVGETLAGMNVKYSLITDIFNGEV